MMEKNKPKTNILLKILWCAGIISCILMMLPVILQTDGTINLLLLPAILYFFLSPAWFATSCAVAVFSGVKKDRSNMVKAIATAIIYFILAVISCQMLYDGMSI